MHAEEYVAETGLYYLQSRYYDPQTGRFLNADGLVSTGQGILGNNMFAYCQNNPIMYKDITGHFLISTLIIGSLIGAGLGAAFGAMNAKAAGTDLVAGAVTGGIAGGLCGGIAGIIGVIGTPIAYAVGTVSGAITGAVCDVWNQKWNYNVSDKTEPFELDLVSVGLSALNGGVNTLVGGGFAAATQTITGTAEAIGTTIITGTFQGLVSGCVDVPVRGIVSGVQEPKRNQHDPRFDLINVSPGASPLAKMNASRYKKEMLLLG